MNVSYRCPHCNQIATALLAEDATEFACSQCTAAFQSPQGTIRDGEVTQCLVCPCKELYIRKDFSQNLGIGIVVAGAVISSVFWFYRMPLWTYGTLFATALIDVVLYMTVGNVLQCYQCQAQYRGLKSLDEHEGFDLETHEKHRQQQIRLARAGALPRRESL
jgi:predicted nucleic acid-binding Zn ribbon protein